MKITTKQLDFILAFNVGINSSKFEELLREQGVTEKMNRHLVRKLFKVYDNNLLKFYTYLDGVNRKVLVNVINTWGVRENEN